MKWLGISPLGCFKGAPVTNHVDLSGGPILQVEGTSEFGMAPGNRWDWLEPEADPMDEGGDMFSRVVFGCPGTEVRINGDRINGDWINGLFH